MRNRKNSFSVLAAIFSAVWLANVAWGDPLADKAAGIAASQRGDYNAAIGLLTHGLTTPALPPGEQADFLVLRGFAHEQAQHYAQAIDDYSGVLTLNPGAMQIYFRRGVAYREAGQYERSLADLNAVLQSRSHPLPSLPFFFGEHGVVNFALGRFTEAAQDFSRVLALDATDQYAALWLYVARNRVGGRDAYELARTSQRAHSNQWPHPLLLLFLGNATRADVEAAAAEGDDDAREDQRCEQAFFVGEYYWQRGAAETARKQFHEAADTCSARLSVRAGAASELQRIGG